MASRLPFPVPAGVTVLSDEETDSRSDEEIVAAISKASADPSSPDGESQRNVWAYWHTGWDSMPPWTKRNVVGWARRCGRSWTIRLLDGVAGSARNIRRFIPPELLPAALNEGRMSGRYAATHCADFARLALLQLYGGVWMDVGALLVRSLDDIWQAIDDDTTPYEFAALTFECRPGQDSIINTLLVAKRGNDMIRRWHQLFLRVWGTSTECTGLHAHPLLQHLDPYRTPTEDMDCHEISVPATHIMDYGAQVLCLERLQGLVDEDEGWDGPAYFARHVFLLPALEEMWYYQQRTRFLGTEQLEILTTRYHEGGSESATAVHERGMDFVQDMLAHTLMLKFCHGPKDVMNSSLADLLDDERHHDADATPGTMAQYLRYGSTHFKQIRPLLPMPLGPRRCRVRNAGHHGAMSRYGGTHFKQIRPLRPRPLGPQRCRVLSQNRGSAA